MIIKCAIVDDEPLALGLLESYVKKTHRSNYVVHTPVPFRLWSC